MNPFENENAPDDFRMTTSATSFLEIAAKWARFLAIIGFIACGLLVLGGVIAVIGGAAFQNSYGGYGRYSRGADFPIWLAGFLYIAIAVVYFLPAKALHDFASTALQAVASKDSRLLENAMGNLKRFFKVSGILTIIYLAFLFLMLMFVMLAAMMAGLR